jgi:hypothetical protein
VLQALEHLDLCSSSTTGKIAAHQLWSSQLVQCMIGRAPAAVQRAAAGTRAQGSPSQLCRGANTADVAVQALHSQLGSQNHC